MRTIKYIMDEWLSEHHLIVVGVGLAVFGLAIITAFIISVVWVIG